MPPETRAPSSRTRAAELSEKWTSMPPRTERYRILRALGEGGMGVVYGAWDELLDRPVAIKQLRVGAVCSADAIEREARALAAVHHPNVVVLYALELNDGEPRLVMEWAEGTTLDRVLARGRPHLDRALETLADIAGGLDAIHRAGAVHGDVKPANVMVDARGHAKLVDFGLVPLLARMRIGDLVGTPAYMPPERAFGAGPDACPGARGDVYSFAVTCFEVLSGTLPFDDPHPERVMLAHAYDAPPRISERSDLGRNFDEPLARGLAKDPGQRPATCGALVSALRRARDSTDVHGRALRVLVVDDDREFRQMLTETIARGLRGATVASASDGELGLAAAWHQPPHLAFVDLSMPGLDGFELARELRAKLPELEVVIVTGHGSAHDWQRARELGVRHFLLKPVAAAELLNVVHQCASRARHRAR